MRVAVDLKNPYKYGGGIGQQVTWLLAQLFAMPAPHEYVLLSPNGYRLPIPVPEGSGYADVAYGDGLGRLSHVWYDQWTARRAVSRARADVYYTPYFDVPLAGTLPPTVATIHDLSLLELAPLYPRAFTTYYLALLRAAVRRARHLVTVSAYSRRRIIELLGVPPDRVTVVHNTLDPSFQPPVDRAASEAAAARIAGPGPYVLYSGGVDARKNVGVLLDGFARVRSALPELRLVCLGARDRYLPYVGGRALEGVVFPGRVAAADLPTLYGAARAVAYPSRYEGFGYPLAEAMACGAPVVAANATSLPEVGGDAALYFDPSSPEELAALLVRVVTDPGVADACRARGLARAEGFRTNDGGRVVHDILQRASGEPSA